MCLLRISAFSLHLLGCCVAVATQQPDVSACTKCDVQLIKVAPDN